MSGTSTRLVLPGLEADNLLAFLALLGLLCALDSSRPQWRACTAWCGTPMMAELHLDAAVDADGAVAAIDAGVHALAEPYIFDRADIKFTSDQFREVADASRRDRSRALVIAALGSDGAVRRNGDGIEATPLCAISGQGHQHFLTRLAAAARRDHVNNAADLSRALFEPWQYDDETDGFRWDPIEDRRHAYQFGDPSKTQNKIGSVTGANRLAAIGFASLTSVPTQTGLATLAVYGRRGERNVCWPLPGVPTSRAGYISLLAHPDLGAEERYHALAAYGVRAVAYSRRYQVEKYANFERARLRML
jgi:hypothetical protein